MSFVPLKSLLPHVSEAPKALQAQFTQAAHELAPKESAKPQAPFDILKKILLNELGPIVASKIHPLFAKNQVVFVVCFDRAPADILRLKEKEIIDKVNEEPDSHAIRGLYVLS